MAPKPHKKTAHHASVSSTPSSSGSKSSKVKKHKIVNFEFEEIQEMTADFSRKCGEGTYAQVFKGELRGQDVAVKIYRPDPDNKRLAKNEIEAFSHFGSYAHVVRLIGTCFHDGTYYLVMRFVNNLKEILKDLSLNWSQTLNIIKQLAKGIKAIVIEGFVIGDVKPDNILIDEEYNVYMCDFGSAVTIGQPIWSTLNSYYSAKEIAKSGDGTDKTDIFSFGVIILQMIMKCNEFDPLNYGLTEKTKEQNLWRALSGKSKNKSASNASQQPKAHLVTMARVEMSSKQHHLVHKTLIQSGCAEEDAVKITRLALQCTKESEKERPSIHDVISALDELKS